MGKRTFAIKEGREDHLYRVVNLRFYKFYNFLHKLDIMH